MNASGLRLRTRSTLVGAALLGAGGLVGAVLEVGGPAAAASTPAAPIAAVAAAGAPPACTMAGNLEGSQASPVIHQGSDVLIGLPGYYPDRNAATTNGPNGQSGPRTGGLLPVGSTTATTTASTNGTSSTGSRSGTKGAVMTGSIEGSQASPVVHQGSDVLIGLPGYYPDRNAATTNGRNGQSGPRTGGLLPVGSTTGATTASTNATASTNGTTTTGTSSIGSSSTNKAC